MSHQIPTDTSSAYAVRSVVTNRTPTPVSAMPSSRTERQEAAIEVDLCSCFWEYHDRTRLNEIVNIQRGDPNSVRT